MAKRTHRSARGQIIDVDSMRLKNEKAIAIGNMKVNARGDELGVGGKVVRSRNQVMKDHYKKGTPAKPKTTQIRPDNLTDAGEPMTTTKAQPKVQINPQPQKQENVKVQEEEQGRQPRGQLAKALKEKLNNESTKDQ